MSDGENSYSFPPEVPIVPIIDMLVAIIFFLVLSTTFFHLSFQSVPPSKTVTVTDPQIPPPPSPKFFVDYRNNEIDLTLSWTGVDPGQRTNRVRTQVPSVFDPNLSVIVQSMAKQFLELHADVQSIQVGLSAELPYQILMAVVEGINKTPLKIVLVSYDEVTAFKNRTFSVPGSGI